MAKVCDICGKKTQSGIMSARNVKKTSGWYNRAPHKKRTFEPNLQSKKINLGFGIVSLKVCTKCLRSMVKINS